MKGRYNPEGWARQDPQSPFFCSFQNLSQFPWQPQVLITIPLMAISPNLSRQETKCVAVTVTQSLSAPDVFTPLSL